MQKGGLITRNEADFKALYFFTLVIPIDDIIIIPIPLSIGTAIAIWKPFSFSAYIGWLRA